MNNNIEKIKLINLYIELFIKERKLIENDTGLISFILRNGDSNFDYLYNNLIPIIEEIFQNAVVIMRFALEEAVPANVIV